MAMATDMVATIPDKWTTVCQTDHCPKSPLTTYENVSGDRPLKGK